MKALKSVTTLSVLVCAVLAAPLSAFAAPHKVCHVDHHHHHPVRVCHWVR